MIQKSFYEKNKLIIKTADKNYEKSFDFNIAQVIQISDYALIVRLISDCSDNQNVFCISDNGIRLWKMQDPDEYQNGGGRHTKCATTGIWMENGQLVAGSWDGHDYFLAPATGKILSDRYVK